MKKRLFLFLFLIFLVILVSYCKEREWSYEDSTGPEYWGKLDRDYKVCAKGSEQSPINITSARIKEDKKFKGKQIKYDSTTINVINNGHTIQANTAAKNNKIIVEGKEYVLAQFHFHTPSEHQFNGQNFDVEMHLVHKDKSGNLAVLGIMIQEGKKNKELETIWSGLPKKETEEADSEKYRIDLQALLPKDQTTFHYDGSLTTPPCTEEVKWVLFEQPIEMSKDQIKAFQKIFEDNHRPVQPLNTRKIIKD